MVDNTDLIGSARARCPAARLPGGIFDHPENATRIITFMAGLPAETSSYP